MTYSRSKQICVLCKKEFFSFSGAPRSNAFRETFVFCTIGSDEESSVRTIQFDVCSDCFIDKLVPFLTKNDDKAIDK